MRDDELLRQYLLGELSDEDKALLEARLIQDEELFETAEAMEADLLEEHAHGRLSAAQSGHMRRRLSSSPAARSRLAVIRGLAAIAQEEVPGHVLRGPWGQVDLSRPWVRGLAAAAMLAIVVPSAWLAMKTAQLPEERARIVAEAPEKPAAPIPAPTAAPVPDKVAQVEPAPVPPPIATPEPAPEPAPWVLTLAFSTLRSGEAEVLQRPTPPPGTKRAEIHISLSAGDTGFGSYEVTLSRHGEPVHHAQGLELRGEKLVLGIDPEKLQEGTYTLLIDGIKAGGEAETVLEQELDLAPAETNPPR